MGGFESRGLGWQRDLKDARDYHPEHKAVRRYFNKVGVNTGRRHLPSCADLREFSPPPHDQGSLNASSAFAVLGLIGYFEARANGRTIDASRLFLYQTSLKLLRLTENAAVDLRTTFKALVRFGTPPEHFWPYSVERFHLSPNDAFLFSYARDYAPVRYLRLEACDPSATLQVVKSFLAAGFAVAFGVSVPGNLNADADIAYRPQFESIRGGHAVVALGYDDRRRIASNTGAILFLNSWGKEWGENGCGWLPYEFITQQFAADFWTVVRHDWIESGAFCLTAS